MVQHARTTILEALVKTLSNLPTTDDNVFTNRPGELEGEELPGLVIVMPSEKVVADAGDSSTTQHRQAEFRVIGFDRGEDMEQRLNRIALEVEDAIFADVTLGVGVKAIGLDGLEITVEDGTQHVGAIEMRFALLYRTAEGSPENIVA